MRLSMPMPRATSCTLAPTFSQRSAISLMKVILVARNALAAYLISSEVRRSTKNSGGWLRFKRPVDLAHQRAGARVGRADHDAVGALEIADRRALAQEFGVGDDDEIGVGTRFADDALDLVAGADRHGRFGDDHGEAVDRRGDLARGGIDVGEVGVAVAAPRRRADRDEHRLGALDRLRRCRWLKESRLLANVGGDEFVEPGLEDRDLARSRAPRPCSHRCRRRRRHGRNRRNKRPRPARHSRTNHRKPHAP